MSTWLVIVKSEAWILPGPHSLRGSGVGVLAVPYVHCRVTVTQDTDRMQLPSSSAV